MPATYTYNDGIEDAKQQIMKAWDEAGDDPQIHFRLVMDVIARLDRLKRPSRRRSKAVLE